MEVRPYALLAARQLAAVRSALERALARWAADWGMPQPQADIARAWEAAPHSAPWQAARQAGSRGLWLAWPEECAAQLQRQLFEPDRRHGPQQGPARLAPAVAQAALAALADALAEQVLGPASAVAAGQAPDGLRRHASGAAAFELRLGKLACHGLLNHAAVQALAAPAATAPALPRLDLAQALAPQAVRLQVAVGQAQVTLGSLLALEEGDVIRLDSLAELPLAVRDQAGRALFGGYLGTAENKLALEVVPGNQLGVKV
ncbi:MAG TPA: FliM/FliN family flagellar motor C-terminal domain-containing protein [Pseudoduganella sp.]